MIFGKNKSLVCFSPNPKAVARLLCFPCAGGGASMYRRWSQLLPELEIWAVNYPGRESLHGQPFAGDVDEIIDPLLEQSDWFDEIPVLLYGHSFGALVAFRTAWRMEQSGLVSAALLVSARRAPHLRPVERFDHLSEVEFLSRLDRFGGIPAAIRNDPDMMDFYMPIIRADLHLNDAFCTKAEEAIDAPLYLYSATGDKVASAHELSAWRESTRSQFHHKSFDGGHFFIQDDAPGFTACIRSVAHTVIQRDDEDLIAF